MVLKGWEAGKGLAAGGGREAKKNQRLGGGGGAERELEARRGWEAKTRGTPEEGGRLKRFGRLKKSGRPSGSGSGTDVSSKCCLFLMALLLLQGMSVIRAKTAEYKLEKRKKKKNPKCCKSESQCPPPASETDEGDGIKSRPSNNHMAAQPLLSGARWERCL